MKHFGFAIVAALATLAYEGGAQAQTTLRYSNWLPAGHTVKRDVFDPWIKEVERVTNGRVKVEETPKVVGTVPGQFDVARDGLADIVLIVNGYTPNRFELSEVAELPFLSDKAEIGAAATYRLHKKHLEKYGEYAGTHVLSTFTVGSGHVLSKKPVMQIADFKGMKLRSPQPLVVSILNTLEAVPVQKPVSELYELLSTGVLDGALINREAIRSFKLVDVVSNLLVVPGGMYNTTLSYLINDGKWRSLSQTDRDAIMTVSGEAMALAVGKFYDRADAEGVEAMRQAGKTVTIADAKFVTELKKSLAPIDGIWLEKARKKGMANPEQVLADLKADLAKKQ